MKSTLLTILKFLVFLGLGILLIWLSVRNLTEKEMDEIKLSLSEANYAWVVLSMVLGTLSHISRAIRWRMLLAPLGLAPKLSNTFYAVIIGYLGNLAINRLGEVLRCGILKRYEKIPLTQSFGTVIAERTIDAFTLLVLFIFTAWIEYARMHDYISENIMDPIKMKVLSKFENTFMVALLIGMLVVGILVLFVFRKKIFQNALVQKIRTLLLSFLDGIKSVGKVKSPALFIFHSLFIWAMYLMTVFACVFAFKETETLSLTDCLAIMCFGTLGVIATPGGIGAYQWIVLQIMMLWGYSASIGVAFGWTVWLAQTAAILILGVISSGMLAISNKEN